MTYIWYDDETDAEREIAEEDVHSLARVIRAIAEAETDHDHVRSALNDFVQLNTMIYQSGDVWPEESLTTDDIKAGLNAAEELRFDYLPDNIRTMTQYVNSSLPSIEFEVVIEDSDGETVASEVSKGIDGAKILRDYDAQLNSVDWEDYKAYYLLTE
jgi:hypothetical protein